VFQKEDCLDLTKEAENTGESITSVHPPNPPKKVQKYENTCTSVNTEINVGENNFRCGESEFAED